MAGRHKKRLGTWFHIKRGWALLLPLAIVASMMLGTAGYSPSDQATDQSATSSDTSTPTDAPSTDPSTAPPPAPPPPPPEHAPFPPPPRHIRPERGRRSLSLGDRRSGRLSLSGARPG